jgi:hypothetical protein
VPASAVLGLLPAFLLVAFTLTAVDDAVALACTEIPLIVDDSNSPLPTLDSTRLLARAALYLAAKSAGEPASAPD